MNFLTQNFKFKILALILAIVLWIFVVGIENTVYLFPQDLEVTPQNIPANLNLSAPLGTAKIRLQASADLIKNLSKNDFEISVDLKDLEAGEYTLPLVAHSNNDKVTILKIEPPVVHLKLELSEEKEVKIKTSVSGNPKKGYLLKDYKLDQQTVKVSGVKDLLAKITTVNAEIKLDGSQDESFTQTVKLALPENIDPDGKSIIILPDQVEVDVTLVPEEKDPTTEPIDTTPTQESTVPQEQQKVVVVQPDIQGNNDLSSLYQKAQVTPLTVTITGSLEALKKVNLLRTEPLQLSWLREQKKPVKVKLIIPPNISLVNSAERTVFISLQTVTNNSSPPPSF